MSSVRKLRSTLAPPFSTTSRNKMRIEFGLKILAVVQEYKGKIELETEAENFLGGEFTREEVDYMLTLMGIRDRSLERRILPEEYKIEE